MVHIAQADKFFEQDYYTPSDDGFKVFETDETAAPKALSLTVVTASISFLPDSLALL